MSWRTGLGCLRSSKFGISFFIFFEMMIWLVVWNLNYIYIDGLKLRMLVWTPVPTRAKLKICVSPAFRNLECAPTPSMKLFGNQQLECSMDICFFQAEIHIYILDHPSHHKKGNLPHNFHSFINFSGSLEVLGI